MLGGGESDIPPISCSSNFLCSAAILNASHVRTIQGNKIFLTGWVSRKLEVFDAGAKEGGEARAPICSSSQVHNSLGFPGKSWDLRSKLSG